MNTVTTGQLLCGCGKLFTTKNELKQHCLQLHNHRPSVIILNNNNNTGVSTKRSCPGATTDTISKKINKHQCMQTVGTGFVSLQSALNDHVQTFFYKNNTDVEQIVEFMLDIIDELIELLQKSTTNGLVKFNVVLHATYFHQITGELKDVAFKSKNKKIHSGTEYLDLMSTLIRKLEHERETMDIKSSGWSLLFIDGLLVRVHKFTPLDGSSYIELPKCIKNKKAVINIKNSDNMCFKWSILCKYLTGSHKEMWNDRYNYLEQEKNINFSGIDFPTPIRQINKFERNNPRISVNVFALDDKNNIFPLRITKKRSTMAEHFDLLLLTSNDNNNHYCYISNFSRLVGKQRTNHQHQEYHCKRCLKIFRNEPLLTQPWGAMGLDEHLEKCEKFKEARAVLPEPGSEKAVLQFNNVRREEPVPLIVYADMECLLKPVNRQITINSSIQHEHVPISYCYYVRPDPKVLPNNICAVLSKEPVLYRGPDAAKHLVNALSTLGRQVLDIMKINNEMYQLTADEQQKFDTTNRCESCSEPVDEKCSKVRDHNHWTGKFRAVLCNRCNLQRRYPTFLPVVFHGLSNYDSHFIIQELAYDTEDICIIPQSEEKYISFSKTIGERFQLRFLDSYRFTQSSLSKLAQTLTRDDFIETKKVFKQHLDMATRKSVFPYEYIDCVEKLNETKLPDISAFHSTLTNSTISEIDYEHAKKMWSTFQCKTIGDYSDKYLLVDVMVLVDVFEKFRVQCLENYKLDPAHYYSCPGLSFDAMLRYTGVKLELITDHDMLLCFQIAIRGGLTLVIQRHARANHPEVDGYDPTKPNTYLQYLDATNLYGTAMMEPMPCGEFEWSDVELGEILNTEDDSDYGYLVQADVDYPSHLHNLHNDLPFLPVNERPPLKGSKYSKLMTTLDPKRKYIVHYRALKQAVEHGLVVTKMYRVIKFKQSRWLAPYIELNTELRKKATTVFGQTLPKLMNNSCYGKTLENVRNHQVIHLVSCTEKLSKLVAKPSFKDTTIFNDKLVAVHMYKEKINFFKPIYIGQAVLDVSKCIMYRFHYDVMLPLYGDKLSLIYMDTDSFIYAIQTLDFHKDLKDHLMQFFDTSNYSKDHPCYSDVRKKVPGTFTDEAGGLHMQEIVALLPKVYAYVLAKQYEQETSNTVTSCPIKRLKEIKKLKGVTSGVVATQIKMDDYLRCLKTKLSQTHKISVIRSKRHKVVTMDTYKLSLSNSYDKRALVGASDEYPNVYTKAWGHYSLKNNNNEDIDE